MYRVAQLAPGDRRDLFNEAASRLGIAVAVVEKDFWVCVVLRILFVASPYRANLIFKGGTSLSKVFHLIDRFSEDIDLVLDWTLLGFDKDEPFRPRPSRTKQDQFNRHVNELAGRFVADRLCPELDSLLRTATPGLSATIDSSDPQVVSVRYPAAFAERYIRPEVRLEIGPLASWVPSGAHTVRPYVAEALPEVFENPDCPVTAIAAERTFWEKATILHQEAHRSGPPPGRHSRHYYDLYRLALSRVKESALQDLALLRAVVEFKQLFYPSAWARYELAVPGSFRLLPPSAEQLEGVAKDYGAMQVMLFGERPDFDEMVRVLIDLESDINALAAPADRPAAPPQNRR